MKSVVLEIRAGVGGEEAALWAADLFAMYGKYAQRQGWEIDVVGASWRGKGFRELVAIVKGKDVSPLTKESGVHRIQRVSVTEKRGRVHTSAASVAVLPVETAATVTISDKDIRVDTYRGSGAGGQHRNKTDSAVRITHLPSGLVVTCEDERSQGTNRERAMTVLKARLWQQQHERQQDTRRADRREQIGLADRSEKMRTYDVPEGVVIDHRTGKRIGPIKAIMGGKLELLHAA